MAWHYCPGGCGGKVAAHQLACRADWFRLPVALRGAVTAAWDRGKGKDTPQHTAAVRDALDWYEAHPRAQTTTKPGGTP
jgi:hypothetical protein